MSLTSLYDKEEYSFNTMLMVEFLKQPQYKQKDYIGISNSETLLKHELVKDENGSIYVPVYTFKINISKKFYKYNKVVEEINKELIYDTENSLYSNSDGLFIEIDYGKIEEYTDEITSSKDYSKIEVIINRMTLEAKFDLKYTSTNVTTFGGWYAHMQYGCDDVPLNQREDTGRRFRLCQGTVLYTLIYGNGRLYAAVRTGDGVCGAGE